MLVSALKGGNVGGGAETGEYKLLNVACYDSTSQTITINSGADAIVVMTYTYSTISDVSSKNIDVSSYNATVVGILNKVGDSITLPQRLNTASGSTSVVSVNSTVTWTNETTVTLSRSGTSGNVLVFPIKKTS